MTKLVLLVEDNPTDEKLTVLAFRDSGIANQVVVVRDGKEALDFLFHTGAHAGREPDELPALMLLDLNLPLISGLEVLRRVRAHDHTKTLPIVVLTSSQEDEDILRSYESGANAYVRKPVDFAEFATAAKTVGLFWLLLNKQPESPPIGQ